MGGCAVNRILFYLPVLFLLLATGPATAARIYTIDPESGETTVTEQGGDEEPAVEEKPAVCPEDEKEIRRLRGIIRRQQQALLTQQALIARLKDELRHKENIIQGLDQLRRQGR
jgi:TolA-binding protein